ncbi:acetyltransferase [Paraburkholderia dinghuensis]|uniref:Acetyltransferase n=1 Tax=Paraburkholderia dinghuensis TaxID=2305225 RepID=A0A3N6PV35_9BURK|nr:acetyltransferase [Paraburkholderia dinghuensis]RQH06070.1 acetyltransferase [Paraburkholderia dinghuensis]
MDKIAIIGSSGHARVVIDIVERGGQYAIAGLIDSFRPVGESTFGYSVIGTENELPQLVKDFDLRGVIVAIGDNHSRSVVSARVSASVPDLPFVSAIHPSAVIGKFACIDAGTVVMAGAVINPGCRIGPGCIVNTRASLDHDSVMEAFSSLAPGVVTGGNCVIGEGSAVGIGATLIHRITVGNHCVIGAGSVVLGDIDAGSVAYGNPARIVRSRDPAERYL